MKYRRGIIGSIIIVCLAAMAAVSFHSVREIHYLKTFYPAHFSVAEAACAAVVELVKVILIAFPLVLVVCVCLSLLRADTRER